MLLSSQRQEIFHRERGQHTTKSKNLNIYVKTVSYLPTHFLISRYLYNSIRSMNCAYAFIYLWSLATWSHLRFSNLKWFKTTKHPRAQKTSVCFHLCATLYHGSPLGVVKGMLRVEAALYNAVLVPRDLCSSFVLQDQQDVRQGYWKT